MSTLNHFFGLTLALAWIFVVAVLIEQIVKQHDQRKILPPPSDPWGPPAKGTMQRSCFWQPWMDLTDPLPFYPPQPWQRVAA